MTIFEITPIAPGIVRIGTGPGAEPVLLGGLCTGCNRQFFPQPEMCPDCYGSVEEIELGSCGRIYSYTVVRTKPPLGLPRPYAIGYVDLEGSMLRVFSLFNPDQIGQLQIGRMVQLAYGPLGEDGHGNPSRRPFFTIPGEVENS
jgi:uncharacterized OB-fold protein